MQYRHLFGPVMSRRLGRSLGVDMVPFKTCNCNCVYCECGAATPVAHSRQSFIPPSELTDELQHFLSAQPELDYVTFAGSGEPTLNVDLGKMVRYVKEYFPRYPTALLTNGTLFHLDKVREDVMPFDLVLPSLDAASADVFHRINRPYDTLDVQTVIDGLIAFSERFNGQMWIEVFIVPGINDTTEELSRLKEVLASIRPTRVQLNSLDRPGACDWVAVPDPGALGTIADFLQPLPVEIISRHGLATAKPLANPENLDGTILHQLRRRPATIEEIAVMCSTTINELQTVIEHLVKQGKCVTAQVDGRTFYRLSHT